MENHKELDFNPEEHVLYLNKYEQLYVSFEGPQWM
jgi:hypothetical protein